MPKDLKKRFKLPWAVKDGHVVTSEGMRDSVAFNVGGARAKFIVEAVNNYERYKRWADHIASAPSKGCQDEAEDLFALSERMKPFIDVWKAKVADLESRIEAYIAAYEKPNYDK
jgi:hypothetical protein